MKKEFLLLFALCNVLAFQLSAQGDFAPLGAKWHYSWAESTDLEKVGYLVYESIGDTTIQGQICRSIKGTLYSKVNNPSAEVDTSDYPGLCVYSNPDTVFYYDVDLERFLPLYVFNVNVDDTVYYRVPGYLVNASQDSLFRMFVTDITYEDIEGITSKTIHHEALDFIGFGYSWGSPINEKIGTMHDGLLLSIIPNIFPEYYSPKIRCYTDPEISYKKFPDVPCDLIEGTSRIKDRTDLRFVEVYPNPTTTELRIKVTHAQATQVELYDLSGRQVEHQMVQGSEIEMDVSKLRNGLYLLKVRFGNDAIAQYEKILIQ